MKDLRIFNRDGVDVVDSRDVAEMIERNHKDLLRDIRGYVGTMENSNGRNFAPVDFFIPSAYTDSKGESRPCYLLTKKGCDMVANKMTGEKGILFTAAYVTAFEKMRQQLAFPQIPKDYPSALRALADSEEKRMALAVENETQRQAIADFQPIKEYVDKILSSKETLTTTQIAADYDLSAYRLNKILEEERIQRNVNGQWILYRKYMGKGYTNSNTINITHSDGRQGTKLHTVWTQKGRLLIHEILTKRGVKAVMDRETSDGR